MKTPTEQQAREADKLLRETENVNRLSEKLIEQCGERSGGIRTDCLKEIISSYCQSQFNK